MIFKYEETYIEYALSTGQAGTITVRREKGTLRSMCPSQECHHLFREAFTHPTHALMVEEHLKEHERLQNF